MDFELIFFGGGGSDAGIVTDDTGKKRSTDKQRTIGSESHGIH